MNLQRLDWFVKVARYGGISQAVRQMPHSIQQPALSEHMAELESELGTKLFVRQPFRLLEAGRELLRLAGPFFEELVPLLERLRDRRAHLRISVSEAIWPKLVTRLVAALQEAHPGLHCSLSNAVWPEVGAALRLGTVDVALAPHSDSEPAGLACQELGECTLALLVPRGCPIGDPDELWRRQPITACLISPSLDDGIAQTFSAGLRQAWMQWRPTIEVDSLTRLADLVAAGTGIGISVMVPWLVRRPGVRVLPLAGFNPIRLAVFWKHPATGMVRETVERLVDLAEHLQRFRKQI